MFKKFMVLVLMSAFLLPSNPVFAWGGRGGPSPRRSHEGFRREIVVHRLPPGYTSLLVGGLSLLYCEGLFYRYTPAGYVVVTPPVGAVVPTIPPGYTTVFENGAPYYYSGYTYYQPAPTGYIVAAPPATVVAPPPAAPIATAPVALVPTPTAALGTPASTPHPALYDAPKEETSRDVYDIYIPNGNGSYTSVTLRKTEKGFLGPQGEFYSDHPTVEQLKERYIKK